MTISLFSVLMALLTSGILTLALSLLTRFNKVVSRHGAKFLLVLYMITIMRFLFPFEVPLAHEVEINALNSVMDLLRVSVEQSLPTKEINVIIIAWASVASILLLLYIFALLRATHQVNRMPVANILNLNSVLMELMSEKDRCYIRIKMSRYSSSPYIWGLVRPVIVLPCVQYKKMDLKYIIEHEYQHYKLRHLWVRITVDLTCICWWWNPAVYLLRKHLFELLEICCDEAVMCGKHRNEIIDYGEILLKFSGRKIKPIPFAAYEFSSDRAILKRFDYILAAARRKSNSYGFGIIIIFTLTICIVIASYTIILQPKYQQPQEGADAVVMIDDFIRNSDGTYTVYTGETEITISEKEYISLQE